MPIVKPMIEDAELSASQHGSQSLRREIEIKREQKMEQEAARSTFQPALSTARRGRDSSVKPVTGSRFDSLYNDAIKRKNTEGSRFGDERNNTFKPTISPKSRSVSRERKPAELFDSLHKAAGAGRVPVKEAPKDSFTPTISKRASSMDRRTSMDRSSSVSDRLYGSTKKQQESSDREKELARQRDAEACTFSPKLYRSRSASRSRDELAKATPVTERLLKYGENMKIRQQDGLKMRKKEESVDLTFKPTINRNNSFTNLNNEKDVYSRLANPIGKSTASVVAEHDVELTFHPKITRSSILSTNEGENVHERLFKEAIQKRKEFDEEQKAVQAEEAAKYTFTPQISHLASKSKDDASVDTMATPVFDRLHDSKQFMQNILSQIKIDLEMSECTFQPALSHRASNGNGSRSSEGPVHERLIKDANKKKEQAERREQERVAAELEGSTFRPHVPESSLGLARRKAVPEGEEGGIYERLSTAHTVSSLGGRDTGRDGGSVSPARSTCSTMDRATVDATVERLLAAGGKHKEDLKAWQVEKATEEMKGATFSPSINEKSLRIALKHKDAIKKELSKSAETPEESLIDSSAASRIPAVSPATTPRRSTFGGRAAGAGIYRRNSEIQSPSTGSVPKTTPLERRAPSSERSRIPVSVFKIKSIEVPSLESEGIKDKESSPLRVDTAR